MSRKRMITYSIILGLLILSLLFGTFTLIRAEVFKRNPISFRISDPGAFCKVEGSFYLGQQALNSNTPTKTFEDSYTEVEQYGKNGKTLNAWNLGRTSFAVVENEDGTPAESDVGVMVFKIRITNYNKEKELGIDTSGIACCNYLNENEFYFSTKVVYQVNGGEEVVKYNNEDGAIGEQKQDFDSTKKVVNKISGQKIAVAPKYVNSDPSYLDITITFTRRVKIGSYSFDNNINFDIYVAN